MSHEGTVDGHVRKFGPLRLTHDNINTGAVTGSSAELALGPFALGYSRNSYPQLDGYHPDWDAWFRVGKLHFELGWWMH